MKSLKNTLIIALVLSISGTLSGATITWIGGNGAWETASNWNPAQLPTVNDEVIINSGSVVISTIAEVNIIKLNGGILTVNGELYVQPTIANAYGQINGLDIADGATFIKEYQTLFLETGSSSGFKRFIFNDGTFLNQSNGYININGSSFTGIHNYSCNSFTNYGIIELNQVNTGIYAVCDTYNYGQIHISSTNNAIGVQNLFYNGSSALVNASNSIVGGSTTSFINNYGVFSNRPDGRLYIQNRLWLTPNSTLNNQGHMFIDYSASQSLINGAFNNTGSLNDVHGTLPTINNTSIIARPISGTIQYNIPIPNALAKGNNPGATVLIWYTTPTGNVSAGSYNNSTNVFTPNSNAIGLSSLLPIN